MPRLELFPFRYRDPVTGKWIRARYRAERHEIALRHAEYEITGPAEIRDIDPSARRFTPHSRSMANGDSELAREPPPELQPHLETPSMVDAAEAALVRLFLRRYVTWCARHRKFAAMNGAVRLHAELGAA
jgi:hypothetical protein